MKAKIFTGILLGVLLLSLTSEAANVVPGSFICQVEDFEDALVIGQRAIEATGGTLGHVYEHALNGFSIQVPPGIVVANLVAVPGVLIAEPDLVMNTCAQTVPTGVDRIDAEVAPDATGVNIAVIDTGCGPHSDLNIVGGTHFYTITTGPPWQRGSFQDDNYADDNGHGTHCAGIVAAKNNGFGVVGVAPGTGVYAVKVLGSDGSGYLSDIIAGVDWVTKEGIPVANMSLGGQGESQSLYDAMNSIVTTFAVAAGNSGSDIYGSDGEFGGGDDFIPAAYGGSLSNVLTISALADADGAPGGSGGLTSYGPDDSFASFSNYSWGDAIAYILPGVDIYSTYLNDGYATKSGTSMAAPHAAGLLALELAASGSFIDYEQSNTTYGLEYLYPDTDGDPDNKPEPLGYSVYPDDGGNGNISPTAGFTYTTSGLTVDFTDTSTDSDGSIASWAWDFGDGATSTAQNPSYTYASDGTYTVTLKVTDNEGATDSASHNVSVSSGGGTMHVSAIDMRYSTAGPNNFVYTEVTIVDDSGSLVSYATVDLTTTLPNGTTASGSGETGSDGSVTFKLKSQQTGNYTSEVTNVTHASLTYDADKNVETSETLLVP